MLAINCYLIQMKFSSPKRRFILELCCRAKVPYWLFVHFFFELSQKFFSGSNFSAASDNFWRSEIFRFFLLFFDFSLMISFFAAETIASGEQSWSGCFNDICFPMSYLQTNSLHTGHSIGWFEIYSFPFSCWS